MKYEKEELNKLINDEQLSYEAIGRLYGVTGNAIKKAASKLGIKLPIRRKIQNSENFSHSGKSKVDKFTDTECKIKNNQYPINYIEDIKTHLSTYEIVYISLIYLRRFI